MLAVWKVNSVPEVDRYFKVQASPTSVASYSFANVHGASLAIARYHTQPRGVDRDATLPPSQANRPLWTVMPPCHLCLCPERRSSRP